MTSIVRDAQPRPSVDHGASLDRSMSDAFTRVRARLQSEIGEVEYGAWLRQMTFGRRDGDEVTLLLPTRFLSDWVRVQYRDRLTALWRVEAPDIRRVDIRVVGPETPVAAPPHHEGDTCPDGPAGTPDAEARHAAAAPGAIARGRATRATTAEPAAGSGSGGDGAPAIDPRFTFDAFVVGKPNEFAHACARRVAEAPSSAGFNPLFLYGGVGLGKTHLMHAVGLELGRRGGVSVAYMSAEKFMYRFISAIRSQSTMEFKEQLRSVDVLMVDDLQFLIGKDNTQEEFFHTFNALVDAGKQIVVSADKSPSDLSGLEDRLRTRLNCGMVADIHATTFELRLSILQAKADRSGITIPPRVVDFLAHKITSNVRELEGALNRLIAHANLFGRPIDLESTHDVLHDILKAHERRVTIEEIQRKVAEHWNLRLSDMSSARRARAVARPRQVAMYLAKQLTSRSLPEIGRKFGNRDHTTVMHAVSRVAELMQRDVSFAEDVELLRRMLES